MRLSSYLASATSIPGPLRHPSVRGVIFETLRRPAPILLGSILSYLGISFAIFRELYPIGQAFGIALGSTVAIYLVSSILTALQRLPWRRH